MKSREYTVYLNTLSGHARYFDKALCAVFEGVRSVYYISVIHNFKFQSLSGSVSYVLTTGHSIASVCSAHM